MLEQHAAEFVVLGLFVLSFVMVLAEILIKDPSALLDVLKDSAEMARPNPQASAMTAQIHQFAVKRTAVSPALRKAA